MMKYVFALLAVQCAILLAGLTSNEATLPQKKSPIVPWYMNRDERERLYPKVEILSSPISQGSLQAFWLTPTMARALASFSIDHEKISADVAEARCQYLRPSDQHLMLVQIRSIPPGASGANVSARLITRQNRTGIAGIIRKVPFPLLMADAKSPTLRGFLVTFPRANSQGELNVKSLDDEVTIVIDFSGQPVLLRAKPKRFASTLEDL